MVRLKRRKRASTEETIIEKTIIKKPIKLSKPKRTVVSENPKGRVRSNYVKNGSY